MLTNTHLGAIKLYKPDFSEISTAPISPNLTESKPQLEIDHWGRCYMCIRNIKGMGIISSKIIRKNWSASHFKVQIETQKQTGSKPKVNSKWT